MSLEDFELLDNEPFDNSIIKRDFLKIYHQQGANLNNSDQNFVFIFGENKIYHQIGNAYFEFDITVRNPIASLADDAAIRLFNNGLAYVFKEARLSTTSGGDLEHNTFVGKVSPIMRVLTSKMVIYYDNLIILMKK